MDVTEQPDTAIPQSRKAPESAPSAGSAPREQFGERVARQTGAFMEEDLPAPHIDHRGERPARTDWRQKLSSMDFDQRVEATLESLKRRTTFRDILYGLLGFCVQEQPYEAIEPSVEKLDRVDADGNLYQAYMPGGRVLVLNKDLMAVANVVPFDRENHQGWKTTSLAIHPKRPEGYLLSGGPRGMWVLKFDALAPGAPLWHLV